MRVTNTYMLFIHPAIRATSASPIQEPVHATTMFKTETQLAQFIKEYNLERDEEGNLHDDEGIYNPYCFVHLDNGKWQTMIGVHTNLHEALSRLNKLINGNNTKIYMLFRANDLEKYAKVYTPWAGIISYSEFLQSSQSPVTFT